MNILDIPLQELYTAIRSDRSLTDKEIRTADRILFQNTASMLPHIDTVMVLGNPTCLEDRAPKAVEIMQSTGAGYLLVTGGVLLPDSTLTEALAMQDFCMAAGIPEEKILVENRSDATNENITMSAPLIAALELPAPQIAVVSSAYHLRRVQMNVAKHRSRYPENAQFCFVPSIHPSCDPANWFLHEAGRKTVGIELRVIDLYLSRYNYAPFDI